MWDQIKHCHSVHHHFDPHLLVRQRGQSLPRIHTSELAFASVLASNNSAAPLIIQTLQAKACESHRL